MQRSAVIFVEPIRFFCNEITARDNKFQNNVSTPSDSTIAINSEFGGLRDTVLKRLQVPGRCWKWSQESAAARVEFGADDKPDAIFPNNSLSIHQLPSGDHCVVLYPMSPGRQREIPPTLIKRLQEMEAAKLLQIVDLRDFEAQSEYLEGTGAINFSFDGEDAFISVSLRAHIEPALYLFTKTALRTKVKNVFLFRAVDAEDKPIYHTNVVGWNGHRVAAYAHRQLRFDVSLPKSLVDEAAAQGLFLHTSEEEFLNYFAAKGITYVQLSLEDVIGFAGNALELHVGSHVASEGAVLIMSSKARATLGKSARLDTLAQLYGGEKNIIGCPADVIEKLGGGSVRCLLAKFDTNDESFVGALFAE